MGKRFWKKKISRTRLGIPGVSSTIDQNETDITGCNCQPCAKEWGSWGGEHCAGNGNCHRTCYNLRNYNSSGNAYRSGDRLGATTGCIGPSTTRGSNQGSNPVSNRGYTRPTNRAYNRPSNRVYSQPSNRVYSRPSNQVYIRPSVV